MELLDFRPGQVRKVRELTDEEYTDYRSAVWHLSEFRRWQYLIEMVGQNRKEFEDAVTSAKRTVKASTTLGAARDAIDFKLNLRLLNFLTSMRFFLDHTQTRLKRRYGDNSEPVGAFKASTKHSYDTVFGYRFLYRLRNVAQHCSLPIGNVQTSTHTTQSGSSERQVTFAFDTPQLLQAGEDAWGQPVKSELEAGPTLLAVPPLVEAAFQELATIHEAVIDAEKGLLEPSADAIVALGKSVTESGGRPVVGFVKGDKIEMVRPPYDVLVWLDRPVPAVDL